MSGFNSIIFSASGVWKSINSVSLLKPSIPSEYVSAAIILSANPNPTNISVFDGAVDIIFSIFVGTLTSLPALSVIVFSLSPLLHPTENISVKHSKIDNNFFFI